MIIIVKIIVMMMMIMLILILLIIIMILIIMKIIKIIITIVHGRSEIIWSQQRPNRLTGTNSKDFLARDQDVVWTRQVCGSRMEEEDWLAAVE